MRIPIYDASYCDRREFLRDYLERLDEVLSEEMVRKLGDLAVFNRGREDEALIVSRRRIELMVRAATNYCLSPLQDGPPPREKHARICEMQMADAALASVACALREIADVADEAALFALNAWNATFNNELPFDDEERIRWATEAEEEARAEAAKLVAKPAKAVAKVTS